MADVKIAPFEHTPMDDIVTGYQHVHATWRTGKTKDVEWRLKQLRKLYWGLKDMTPKIQAALKKDLGKPPIDAIMSEVLFCTTDLMGAINNLKTWVKDDKNLDYPLAMSALKPRIKKEPIGTVLIIGPYNFPLMLCLSPLVGAISAGCTAVIKPSESAPATCMVIKELIETYLDTSSFKVVNGAIPETTALLDQKWDKIFYTGNPTVARIIYKKAAEHLTPVVLELGGRNPAFVTKASDVALAARRLLWGKCVNAGQVCISHNYVQVQRDLVPYFIECLNNTNKDFFPKGPRASPDYARIVNHRQFDRIKKMLDSTKGKIVMGGETDRDDLFIAPTAVLVDSVDDPMMVDESFGPIWSILPFDNLDDAIKVANQVDPTPLSLMTFGSKAENDKILNSVTSGGATINDSFMHGAIPTIPFGGVGESGTGAYHGVSSFETFTHRRTIVEVPGWMEKLLRARYVPYDMGAWKQYQWINSKKVDFDRNGNQIKGLSYWMWMLFGLGGPTAKGALLRWLFVLASGYATLTFGVPLKNKYLS
ncbi:aldehyde dehydrogenase [Microdochium bolleyi]|uniref:Aldehyde dehydrogenase n=1 Tax=Microdochium bolleyi TaxID=196109 RepID=A0A136J1K7_9PEZI|nr:aldehyde dehydrogenase [Microdochium bolleyi]